MSRPASVKVAVAQVESILGDLEANAEKHLEVIAEARRAGCQALLFPEVSLVGHGAGPEILRLARDRHDPLLMELAEASGDMCTVFGFVEEGPAAQFHNTAMAVRGGEILFLHRKINIPTYGLLEEGKFYASGRYIDTFELAPRWRASILICADLWNPALVHLAAVHGTTLLFVPISSAVEAVGAEFDNPSGWELNLRFYAMTYGLPLLMANRVGKEGELTFWGGSRILDPFGRTLAKAGEHEELIMAELDYERLRKARYLLPTVRDSDLELIVREAQRLAGVVGVPESIRKSF
jgi:predicted amidohydrolase